jgi:hypothetical protein
MEEPREVIGNLSVSDRLGLEYVWRGLRVIAAVFLWVILLEP